MGHNIVENQVLYPTNGKAQNTGSMKRGRSGRV
jgi:hypothetical protein